MQFDQICFLFNLTVVFIFYMPHHSCYLQGNFTGKASEIGMEVLKAFSFYIVYLKKTSRPVCGETAVRNCQLSDIN